MVVRAPTDSPPEICDQVKDQIDALQPTIPTVLNDDEAGQLVKLSKKLESLATVPGEASRCADLLGAQKAALGAWAGLLLARSLRVPGQTDEQAARARSWAAAARVLDPDLPQPVPGSCTTAQELIDGGEYGRAAALLTALKASEDKSLADCVAAEKAALAVAIQQNDAGTAADTLSSWYDRYITPLLLLLVWGVVIAGGVMVLFRLVSSLRPPGRPSSQPASAESRKWALGNVVFAGALWLATLLMALLLPGVGGPSWAAWLGAIVLAIAVGAVMLRPKMGTSGGVRLVLILLLIVVCIDPWLDQDRATTTLLNLIMAGVVGVTLGLLAWMRTTRLIITPFALDAAPGPFEQMDKLLIAEIRRIGDGQSRGIDVMGATDIEKLPFDLASGVDVTKFIQFFVGVWQYLVPGGDWRLDGVAHGNATDYQTVSVRLRQGRAVVGSETFVSRLFVVPEIAVKAATTAPKTAGDIDDKPADTPPKVPAAADLVTAVAAWIILITADKPDAAHQPNDVDQRLYGATSWRSLALMVVAERRTEPAEIEHLLSRACDLDANNLGAAYNLLAVRSRRVEKSDDLNADYDGLILDLKALAGRAPTILKISDEAKLRELPLTWRLRYSLGAILLNKAMLTASIPGVLTNEQHARVVQELRSAREHLVVVRMASERPNLSDVELANQFRWLSAVALQCVKGINSMIGAQPSLSSPASPARVTALIDRSIGARYSFSVCCALLAYIGDRELEEFRPQLRRLIQRFSQDPYLVDRARKVDPFFFRLQQPVEQKWLDTVVGGPPLAPKGLGRR